MDILGWLAIAIAFIVFLALIVAALMQSPEEDTCECKPAKFCSQCGKRLSDQKSKELM
jgi:hypothetical protein